MRDSALAQKLVDNGLEEVKKYTWERVWPLLGGVYGRLLPTAAHPVV
jgi:hypothetical protein